jgi:AcrR family transcriptional regulator
MFPPQGVKTMNDWREKSGTTPSSRTATRAAILATFNRLMLESQSNRPRVAEIVAEAGVARSTFYDHFEGVEALFDESLSMLLGQVAQGLVRCRSQGDMVWLMEHIHDNRERGREMLAGPGAERTETLLARLVMRALEGRKDARLHAILIAGMAMAALGAWVTGRLSTTPAALAERLVDTAQAILSASPADAQ